MVAKKKKKCILLRYLSHLFGVNHPSPVIPNYGTNMNLL